MRGTIVKGIAGFYYVKCGGKVYSCKARGIFRKENTVPRVGDEVSIEIIDAEEAVINEIHERRNEFIRPPVANVDCFVIVIAVKKPEPNLSVIDKFIVMAELYHTDIIVCLNKIDLAETEEVKVIADIYENLYPLTKVSGKTGEGIPELACLLRGKKCALTGPSGTGKSTLLNRLHRGASAETGEISSKSQRGKHTTRHVELFETEGGGMLFDTPGFTSFEVLEAEEGELAFLYPEMVPFIGSCRYDNCRHISEPDCRVRQAVTEGKIHKSRYESYKEQMKEIQEKRKY